MAKELPYFQFEPAEYLTKDISFCSLSAQGMFINVCAYYWQRGCELTKQQVLRRLNHEEAFNELIDEGVIYLDGEYITISFLKDQYDALQDKKNDSSVKGQIGNLKRWNEDVYKEFKVGKITLEEALNIAKSSGSDKTAIAKTSEIRREEKIKEEKKENNINNSLFDIEVNTSNVDEFRPKLKQDLENTFKEENIDNSKFTKQCKVVGQWLETVAMTNKISIDTVKVFIDQFDAHLINYGEQKRTIKDFKQHFSNWLPKQNLSQFRTTPVGRSNQVNYGN